MTVETEYKVEDVKVEVEEKCGLDMSSYEDLPPPTVGGGTVGVGCNGDGKDDYVIINSSDASSDDPSEVNHANEKSKVSESNIKFLERGGEGDPTKSDAAIESEKINEVIEDGENVKKENDVRIDGGKTALENGDGVKTENGAGVEVSDSVNGDSLKSGDEVPVEGLELTNADGEHDESENKVATGDRVSATENLHDLEPEGKVNVKDEEVALQVGRSSNNSESLRVNGDSEKSKDEVGVMTGESGNTDEECDRSENKLIVDDSDAGIESGLGPEAENEVKVQEQELTLEDGEKKNSESGLEFGSEVEDAKVENQDTPQPVSVEINHQESDVQNQDTPQSDYVEINHQELDAQNLEDSNSSPSDCIEERAPASSSRDDNKSHDALGSGNSNVDADAAAVERTEVAVVESEHVDIDGEVKDLLQPEHEDDLQKVEVEPKALSLPDDKSRDKDQKPLEDVAQPTSLEVVEGQPLEDEDQPKSVEVVESQPVEDDHTLEEQEDEVKKLQPFDGEFQGPNLPKDEAEPSEDDYEDLQMKQPLNSAVTEGMPSSGKVQDVHHSSECKVELEGQDNSETSVVLASNTGSEDLASGSAGCNLQQSKDDQVKVTDQKDPVLTQESEETQEMETTHLDKIEKQTCLDTTSGVLEGNDSHATDTMIEEKLDSHGSVTGAEERKDPEDTDLPCDETAIEEKPELTIEVVETSEPKTGVQPDGYQGPLITENETVDEESKIERDNEVATNQESQIDAPVGIHHTQMAETEVDHATDEVVSSGSFAAESGNAADAVQESSKLVVAADEPALNDSPGDFVLEATVVNVSEYTPQLGESSDDTDNGALPKGDDMQVPLGGEKRLPISSYADKLKESEHADSSVSKSSLPDTAHGSGTESEVHGSDVKDSNNILASGAETDLESGQGLGERRSACFVNGLSLGAKISFGSFDCEQYAANSVHGDVMEPQISNETTMSARAMDIAADDNSESKLEDTSQVTRDLPSNGSISSHHMENGGEKHDLQICDEVGTKGANSAEVSTSSVEGLVTDAVDGQNANGEMVSRPFHYLIKIPRYDDEKHREQIRLAEIQVEERTKGRDAVREEYQRRKAAFRDLRASLEAARSEERAARDLVRAKRQEVDSAQSVINRAKTALTIEDAGSRVMELERRIQHETVPLNEEKQLIREIKQLKQRRDQLSSNASKKQEIQQALAQKDKVEEQLKVLRKEMDVLREKVLQAEAAAKIAKKKYDDEGASLNDLNARFRSADAVRQEAYAHLLSLRKQWSEKNKYFWNYKNDAKIANDYVVAGDKEGLQRHCVNQVETFMALWNNNDEFRREYTRYNTRSTLRRLRTLDGRALGPDEEPHFLGIASNGRGEVASKINSIAPMSSRQRHSNGDAKKVDAKSSEKVEEVKNQKSTFQNIAEPQFIKDSLIDSPRKLEGKEEEEKLKLSKEEDELARKEEKLRREQEAAKLKEQRRLEEKAKAQEALERKRRIAEKAQARAEFRARKEAEEKEKERERRARKKEKKGVHSDTPPADGETEAPSISETPRETIKESETKDRPTVVRKRPQRPSIKLRSIPPPPPPLRNRGRRRMQSWMWVFVIIVSILALFFLGNSKFFLNNRILGFNDTQ